MGLLRRKKKEGEVPLIVQLYMDAAEAPLIERAELVEEHLENLHQGGLDEEKKTHDFIDFAMSREYMDALDNLEFTIEDQVSYGDQVISRWTVRGIHRRPLLGLEPSGESVTISGATVSVVKYERVRQEWAYWDLPEFVQRVGGT
jgi:predicted ester cyclase